MKRRKIPIAAAILARLKMRSLLQFDTTNLPERQRLISDISATFSQTRESADYAPSIAHHVLEGRWEVAQRIGETIVANLDRPHAKSYLYEIAELARLRGDRALAWSLVAVYFPDGPPLSIHRLANFLTDLVVLAAMLALDAGDRPLASRWITLLASLLERSGAIRARPTLLLLEARHAATGGDVQPALGFVQQGLELATQLGMPLAILTAQRQFGELLNTAGAYARAEDCLHASLSLADACAAPFERALTLLEIAKLRASQRRIDEAKTLLTKVRSICEPLGARPTLQRVAALEQQIDG